MIAALNVSMRSEGSSGRRSIAARPQERARVGLLHTSGVTTTIPEAAVRAAVTVAARFTVSSTEPVVLADGANIVVHLRPAPVVAKVAASTPEVRPRVQDWL